MLGIFFHFSAVMQMRIEEFKNEIKKILQDKNLAIALSRAISSYRINRAKIMDKFPNTYKLVEEVRRIKEDSVERIQELVETATENMIENGIDVHFAKDAEEGRKIAYKLLSDCNCIVKAKSMTCEEIRLREFLESKGIEVWETDLGEFIVQMLNDKPMHIITPAIHIPRETIVKALNDKMDCVKASNNIQEIVKAVKSYLRNKFFEADAGISGANVVAAETGSMIIIENEGNARLATGLPEKHVAIIGVEKIVPTLSDAIKVAEVTWRFAGYAVPSYLNIISSPSKTGDIEKIIVKGAHGPKDLHVVFLDNGRIKASQDEYLKEALLCLRCGSCMYECPIYQKLSGHWGGEVYTGGIGIAWTAITGGDVSMAFLCLLCSRCAEVCPMKIDSSKILRELRKKILYKK